MFRVLLIIFLIGYILFKAWSFFFRMLGYGAQRQYQAHQRTNSGNVNVEFDSKKDKKRKTGGFNGGEYIDYEEVK
jgi:hypothetical protein